MQAPSNDLFTAPHGLADGTAVFVSADGAGLSDNTTYYVHTIDDDTVSFYSSRANALLAGTLGRSASFSGIHRMPPEMHRPSGRRHDELRPVRLTRNYTRHAEGAVLVEFGDTKVICTASVEEKVPPFLKGKGQGWVTAEYGMLPRATNTRSDREAARGKQSGRTQEIQRLIGRSLRSVIDLAVRGERTLQIDCDVIQADGGTRTASITGGFVAAYDAIRWLRERGMIETQPVLDFVAAVSVGVFQGVPLLDLDYIEDST